MSTRRQPVRERMAGALHDLNQSLSLVVGFIELAEHALSAGNVDDVRTRLNLAGQAARDGCDVIAQALAQAGSDAPYSLRRLDLSVVLRDIAALTAPRWSHMAQLQGRPIQLTVEAPGGLLVNGSPYHLRSALINIVFNAIDALPRGGHIRLIGRRMGNDIVVEVADNGVGMPPDVYARCFEPYVSSKGPEGTGLGLAQVHAIVSEHGGRLDVESDADQGTTVRLALPAIRAHNPGSNEQPAEARSNPARRGRILVVEDQRTLRELIALILAQDHDVELVASVEEALDRLESTVYDLLISDLALGSGMTGWELASRVRSRWPETPLVLITGSGAELSQEQASEAGAQAVLSKPFSARELRRVADVTISRRLAADNAC